MLHKKLVRSSLYAVEAGNDVTKDVYSILELSRRCEGDSRNFISL